MKVIKTLAAAALALPLMLTSCRTAKTVEKPAVVADSTRQAGRELLEKVSATAHNWQFVTSKIKFKVEFGSQEISLTGNLKMKRDDVIRLQLMAFGFVEAARLEFTKDYVLVMDRINKQYLKVPYNHLDFMRNSGINFYTLQGLFWGELFAPGRSKVTADMMGDYHTDLSGDNVIISLDGSDKLSYRWLADKGSMLIRMANVRYLDKYHGNSQLNWDYTEFKELSDKPFPSRHAITLTLPKKEVKINLTLNYLGHESDWETRTPVSSKYKEVDVDYILRRLMSM